MALGPSLGTGPCLALKPGPGKQDLLHFPRPGPWHLAMALGALETHILLALVLGGRTHEISIELNMLSLVLIGLMQSWLG